VDCSKIDKCFPTFPNTEVFNYADDCFPVPGFPVPGGLLKLKVVFVRVRMIFPEHGFVLFFEIMYTIE